MSKRPIDPTTYQRQIEASSPNRSAWVSANAGSGKTHVLAQRVVRLLLAGADPARLLCLTFTKAAAAEMAVRVFDQLADWVLMPEAELERALEELEGGRPSASLRSRARRLLRSFCRAGNPGRGKMIRPGSNSPGGRHAQLLRLFAVMPRS